MPDVVSLPSTTSSATYVPSGWELKDPSASALNIIGLRAQTPIRVRPREPQTSYDAMGRPEPISVSEGRKGADVSVTVQTQSQAEYDALEAILATSRVLLLVDGALPRQWYVKAQDRVDIEFVRAVDPAAAFPVRHLHGWSIEFRTAKKPA